MKQIDNDSFHGFLCLLVTQHALMRMRVSAAIFIYLRTSINMLIDRNAVVAVNDLDWMNNLNFLWVIEVSYYSFWTCHYRVSRWTLKWFAWARLARLKWLAKRAELARLAKRAEMVMFVFH